MTNPMWSCPDGGYCHHECRTSCFRVLACGPLSNVFPRDEWPEELVRFHTKHDVTIGIDGTHYRWSCSCGSKGIRLIYRESVERLAAVHLAKVSK